jgi:glycerophosphoryl diester phosphodiesterase
MKEIDIQSKQPVMVIAMTIFLLAVAGNSMAQTSNVTNVSGITKPPLIIGHRGAAGLAPENTMAGFKQACEIGVDAIELDVLLSANDELVVHHDYMLRPEIARSKDGNWITSD